MRAALGRVGGIVLAAALATGFLAAPAHAEPSTISGTITAADTGEPVGLLRRRLRPQLRVRLVGVHRRGRSLHGRGPDLRGWPTRSSINPQDPTYRFGWADGADDFETTTPYTAPATVDVSLQLAREVGDATLSGTLVDATSGRGRPRLSRAAGAPATSTSARPVSTVRRPTPGSSVAWWRVPGTRCTPEASTTTTSPRGTTASSGRRLPRS